MELAGRTGSAVKKAYVAQHSADLIFNEGVVGAAKDDGVDFAAVFADEAFKHVGQVGSIQIAFFDPAGQAAAHDRDELRLAGETSGKPGVVFQFQCGRQWP